MPQDHLLILMSSRNIGMIHILSASEQNSPAEKKKKKNGKLNIYRNRKSH